MKKTAAAGYEFGNSLLENLKAMSKQRDIADVAKECDVAFCRDSKEVEGLKTFNAPDPLRAAIDYARDNDVTCLVMEHAWFCVVPSRKANLGGWVRCLKIWGSIDEGRRINDG